MRSLFARISGRSQSTVPSPGPALQREPDMRLLREGDAARDRRDWLAAAAAYESHLENEPDDFDIWVQLGHMRKEAVNFEAANRAYIQASAIAPMDADLLLQIGHLRKLQGDMRSAADFYKRSLELKDSPEAAIELSRLVGVSADQLAASGGEQQTGGVREKILSSGYFDPNWYIENYPDLLGGKAQPLEHFIEYGGREWRSPGPNFDTNWYLHQNPDVAHGVMIGLFNPLVHFLDHGRHEGRAARPPAGVLKSAMAAIESVIDLEPGIYASEPIQNLKALAIADGREGSRVQSCVKSIFESLDAPYDYIVCLPWLIHGGADLVATHFIKAVVESFGLESALVLICDHDRLDALAWMPRGIHIRSLPAHDRSLSVAERAEVISLLIQAVRPRAVLNVNSEACWELFKTTGRTMSQLAALYGCMFCRDYTADGRPAGYSETHFRESIPFLTTVFLDNGSFADELSKQFGLPDTYRRKLVPIRQPITIRTATRTPPASATDGDDRDDNRPRTVFWASRFCRQKNIDLLLAIARQAPDIRFDIWGKGDDEFEEKLRTAEQSLRNITLKGPYSRFSDISTDRYGAFVYTSLWDGIPNVLLEVGAAGVPIVAPNIGGIRELVTSDTGWLIEDPDSTESFVSALREIIDDPREADRRAAEMLALLDREHSWDAYRAALTQKSDLLRCSDAEV